MTLPLRFTQLGHNKGHESGKVVRDGGEINSCSSGTSPHCRYGGLVHGFGCIRHSNSPPKPYITLCCGFEYTAEATSYLSHSGYVNVGLTVKTDRDGKFEECTARLVLRGLQDHQKDAQQTDSPTSTRPGLCLLCQNAASNGWSMQHIDLKTAFLQRETYAPDRDVVCLWQTMVSRTWVYAQQEQTDVPTCPTLM